jgi:hypothetical protein
MLGISRVAGNLQKIYTAGMETGSVPNLGRKADYRRECCPASDYATNYAFRERGLRKCFRIQGARPVWDERSIIVVNVALVHSTDAYSSTSSTSMISSCSASSSADSEVACSGRCPRGKDPKSNAVALFSMISRSSSNS